VVGWCKRAKFSGFLSLREQGNKKIACYACACQYNIRSEIKQRRILRRQSRSTHAYYAKKQKTTQRSKQTKLKQQQQQQQQQQQSRAFQLVDGAVLPKISRLRRPFMCLRQLANLKALIGAILCCPCHAAGININNSST
jgi:Flp pilus assembly protein TadB